MHIVFDARWIIREPSGIGVYTRAMLERLPKLLPDAKFTVLFRDEGLSHSVLRDTGLGSAANIEKIMLDYGPFSPKGQLLLPRLLKRIRCDVFYTTNYAMPYMAFRRSGQGAVKCVATIHDVIPLIFNDYAPSSRTARMKKVYRFCLRQTLARANRVITVSESSARDIVARLNASERDAAKLVAILNGVSDAYGEGAAEARRARSPELFGGGCDEAQKSRKRVLLYIGRLDPYKNVPLLVEAFADAEKRLPFPARLKIVGPRDDRYPEAQQVASKLGLGDKVKFCGFVVNKVLVKAYRNADLLVHPSSYEGFGLQIAEAMKSALPVVCADGGSLREVAGDAAVVVKAGDRQALADAIVGTLTDNAKLRELIDRGAERAKLFSWDRAAEAVAGILKDL